MGVRGRPLDLPALRQATGIVWHDVYRRTDRVPIVQIVQGDALDCIDPNSKTPGFRVLLHKGFDCRNGYTASDDKISIAWTGQPWSETTLAHELRHAAQLRDWIIDPTHQRDDWQRDLSLCPSVSLTCGIVERANLILREKGL